MTSRTAPSAAGSAARARTSASRASDAERRAGSRKRSRAFQYPAATARTRPAKARIRLFRLARATPAADATTSAAPEDSRWRHGEDRPPRESPPPVRQPEEAKALQPPSTTTRACRASIRLPAARARRPSPRGASGERDRGASAARRCNALSGPKDRERTSAGRTRPSGDVAGRAAGSPARTAGERPARGGSATSTSIGRSENSKISAKKEKTPRRLGRQRASGRPEEDQRERFFEREENEDGSISTAVTSTAPPASAASSSSGRVRNPTPAYRSSQRRGRCPGAPLLFPF